MHCSPLHFSFNFNEVEGDEEINQYHKDSCVEYDNHTINDPQLLTILLVVKWSFMLHIYSL